MAYRSKEIKEIIPLLRRNGYSKIRTKGSHFIYSNGKNTISINLKLNEMVKRRIIKENHLV